MNETALRAAPERRAVACTECTWEGRRLWPGPKRPCPACGAEVHVDGQSRVDPRVRGRWYARRWQSWDTAPERLAR